MPNQKKRTSHNTKSKNNNTKNVKGRDNLAIILSIVLFAILAISGIAFNVIEAINRNREITSLNEQVSSLKESVNILLNYEGGITEDAE